MLTRLTRHIKRFDRIDQAIFNELQADGRQSYREVARKIGVTEGTVRNRVRDLLKNNVMKMRAVIDPVKLGYQFVCVMGMEVRLADLEQVGEKLAQSPNVYYLAHATGRFDLITILLFHTAQELAGFVRENISKMPGITRTETFVNMNIVKSPWLNGFDLAELLKSEDLD